jgi:hypothetical protein
MLRERKVGAARASDSLSGPMRLRLDAHNGVGLEHVRRDLRVESAPEEALLVISARDYANAAHARRSFVSDLRVAIAPLISEKRVSSGRCFERRRSGKGQHETAARAGLAQSSGELLGSTANGKTVPPVFALVRSRPGATLGGLRVVRGSLYGARAVGFEECRSADRLRTRGLWQIRLGRGALLRRTAYGKRVPSAVGLARAS